MANTLRVGAASPDPPFNGAKDDGDLDILLMHAIAEFVPHIGPITISVATESTVPVAPDRLLPTVSNQPGRH